MSDTGNGLARVVFWRNRDNDSQCRAGVESQGVVEKTGA
jgi:hypothetical protein